MSKQQSPFAALTGAEKQIRWLEYQSIRLPYVEAPLDGGAQTKEEPAAKPQPAQMQEPPAPAAERPQPPPEVPRSIPADFHKTRHSQYDAVIARLKQAELQSRRWASNPVQQ